MLDAVDGFLEGLFTIVPYLAIIIFGLIACVLLLFCLFGLTVERGSTFQKLEGLGLSVITICCCYWFFVWVGDMGPSEEGYSHVGPTLAFGITALVWFLPFILRSCLVPFFVSAFVYFGIVLFGV